MGYPVRAHSPSQTPLSNPEYPMLSSASHGAYMQRRASQSSMQPLPQPAKRRRALLIIGPAVLVGVILGVAFGFGGSKKHDQAAANDTPAVETPPAEAPSQPNPGVGSAASPDTTNPSIEITEIEAEAADTKPAVPDIQPEVAETKPEVADTKPEVAETKPETPRTPQPDTQTKPDHERKPRTDVKRPAEPDVADLYKEKKYGDVVEACSGSSKVVALNSATCTVAACKENQAAKAKKWFGSVGAAKKASVQRECSGVLAAEKSDEKCKDPMACQH